MRIPSYVSQPQLCATKFSFYFKICLSSAITSQFKEYWTNAPWTAHLKPQEVNDSTKHFTCKSIPRAHAIRFVIYSCQNEHRLWDSRLWKIEHDRWAEINTQFQRLLKTTHKPQQNIWSGASLKINSVCTLGWSNQTYKNDNSMVFLNCHLTEKKYFLPPWK